MCSHMFRSCKALLAAAAALRVDLILMLRQGPSRKVIDAARNFKNESELGLLSMGMSSGLWSIDGKV